VSRAPRPRRSRARRTRWPGLKRALAPVLGALDTSGLVRALHVADGEVELQLALRADCGGAALADSAFHALRALLPDTDIYVLPAR
jgi:hypothetical protein